MKIYNVSPKQNICGFACPSEYVLYSENSYATVLCGRVYVHREDLCSNPQVYQLCPDGYYYTIDHRGRLYALAEVTINPETGVGELGFVAHPNCYGEYGVFTPSYRDIPEYPMYINQPN